MVLGMQGLSERFHSIHRISTDFSTELLMFLLVRMKFALNSELFCVSIFWTSRIGEAKTTRQNVI